MPKEEVTSDSDDESELLNEDGSVTYTLPDGDSAVSCDAPPRKGVLNGIPVAGGTILAVARVGGDEVDRFDVPPELVATLEARVRGALEETVQAAGAGVSHKALAVVSTWNADYTATFAKSLALHDTRSPDASYRVANYAAFVTLEEKTTGGQAYRVKRAGHVVEPTGCNKSNMLAWLRSLANVPDVVYLTVATTGAERGAGWRGVACIYPKLCALTIFSPDGCSNNVRTSTFDSTIGRIVRKHLQLDGYLLVECANAHFNWDGAPLSDLLQYEMEHLVGTQLGDSFLSEHHVLSGSGYGLYSLTWSFLAMYLCMRLKVHHPRLVMGMLQRVLRRDPALTLATLAGAVTRVLSLFSLGSLEDEFVNALDDLDKAERDAEDSDDRAWHLSESAMKRLKINERRAKGDYASVSLALHHAQASRRLDKHCK